MVRLTKSSFKRGIATGAVALSAAVAFAGCDFKGLFQTGRLSKSDPYTNKGDFLGCIDGVAIDNARIRINFEFPAGATRMSIYRDGTLAFSSDTTSIVTFTDNGLNEGQSYRYTCEATIRNRALSGQRALTLQTMSVNAPNFPGINVVTDLDPSTANAASVTWFPTVPGPGVQADTFKVYANPGATVNWALPPKKTLSAGNFSTILTGLADDMPYAFGVRACSAASICDSNVVQRTLTMADTGAPRSTGIASGTTQNGAIVLTVPWDESMGAVKIRKVYRKTGNPAPVNLTDFDGGGAIFYTATGYPLATPPTSITLSSSISENTTYYFMVLDEDPNGQTNSNTAIVRVATGDLTAPIFAGITSQSLGLPQDSSVVLNFNAINREGFPEDVLFTGASHYNLYYTQAAFPTAPADPCASTTIFPGAPSFGGGLSTTTYPPGAASIQVSGLTPRTNYRFCMKARDSSNNESTNTASLAAITTLDLTAPTFACAPSGSNCSGVQSILFDQLTASIRVSWAPSSSSDIEKYTIRIWKNDPNPAATDPHPPGGTMYRPIDFAHSTNANGASITTAQFPFGDNDVIYAIVNACDNAETLPGGAQNCTSFPVAQAVTLTLPDITPPSGFTGIASVGSTVNGQATIVWGIPPVGNQAEYHHFNVGHIVAGSFTPLQTCNCPSNNCVLPSFMDRCTVTGLDPYRTYKFHVQGCDGANNCTQLDLVTNTITARVADTVAPSFNSGLSATFTAPSVFLTMAPASDNQYASEPGAAIYYEVFRNIGSAFADPTNPPLGNRLAASAANTLTSFTDSALTDGQHHFYVVCARDGAGNRTCDGAAMKDVAVTDATLPSITGLASTKTSNPALKRWDLSWTMNDNISATANMRVNLYSLVADTAHTFLKTDPGVVLEQLAVGSTSRVGLTGPADLDGKFVNYMVEVIDEANNTQSASLSVATNNRMQITGVTGTRGLVGGGQLIVILGSGFSKGSNNGYGTDTAIQLGTAPCTGVTVLDSTRISCTTPAGSSGVVSINATNPEGSFATLANSFTYEGVTTDPCLTFADDPSYDFQNGGIFPGTPAAVNPNYAGTIAGTLGQSSGDAFLVCNVRQFGNIAKIGAKLGGTYYVRLGSHIDMGSFAQIDSFDTSTSAALRLDGGGFALINYSNAVNNAGGIFSFYPTSAALNQIKNLNVLGANVNVTAARGFVTGCRNSNAAGILADCVGAVSSTHVALDNVFVSGSLTVAAASTAAYVGGIAGRLVGNMTHSGASVTINNQYAGTGTGGLIGEISGNADDVSSSGTVTSSGGIVGGAIGRVNLDMNTANCPAYPCGISHATSSVNVTASGSMTGGLIGALYQKRVGSSGRVEYSSSSGNVTGTTIVGGLVGAQGYSAQVVPEITRSYSTSRVVATGNASGGLVGEILGITPDGASATSSYISESYAAGTLSSGAAVQAGGLVGLFSPAATGLVRIIRDSYSHTQILAAGATTVGGLIGQMSITNPPLVQRCYASGQMNAGLRQGLLFASTTIDTIDSFYDNQANGGFSSSSGGGTGLATSAMQDQSNYPVSWDFTNVWVAPSAGNYPKLKWQP